jgi:hypothetical protein
MANGSYDKLYGKYGRQRGARRGRTAPQAEMPFIDKIKEVSLRPSQFFEAVRHEADVMPAFRYTGLFILIMLIPGIILAMYTSPTSLLGALNIFTILLIAAVVLLYYIIYMLATFAGAGLLHVTTKVLKGTGNYIATYKAMAYGMTPYFLFGWIINAIVILFSPGWLIQIGMGLAVTVYIIYLQMVGLSKLHDISKLRAFFIIMLPLIVAVVIVGIIVLYVLTIPLISLMGGLS